ncbi:MAG: serine/threonine-protein kinase [Myxococcota bacterium]
MQELAPGHQVAGYEVIRHVSSGGMASLYLARRKGAAGFSKPVAVKVVHPHLAREKKFIRMFLDEAQLAARIQHPNVVSVEELVEANGTYLMVMEYVHGCALFDLIKTLAEGRRRLSVDLVAWLGAQIADGLHAAHELRDDAGQLLNVVHRDVSPQNILLSAAGYPKLIDFGIAKSRAQSQATRTGVLRGKLGYMSPEQAGAQPLDRRTDVYALGIVLWECLTSRRLFKGKNEIEQLDLVRSPKVRPPSEYADVPKAVEDVVMDALKPRPSDRIASAAALRTRLLEACPAAAVGASETLAALLVSTLGDSLTNKLPPEVSKVLSIGSQPAVQAENFVQQHTKAAPDALFGADHSEELDEDDLVFDPEQTAVPARGGTKGAGAPSSVFIDPYFVPPPQDLSEPPPLDLPEVPPPNPMRESEGASSLLPRMGAGTAKPSSLRLILRVLSILIFLIATGLAGFLAWREMPDDWNDSGPPRTPEDQAERLLGTD